MAEEAVEQAGQRVVMAVVQGAGRVALKIGGRIGAKLTHGLAEAGKWPVRKTRDMIHEAINSGRMSEKRLQNLSGGDLHQVKISDEGLREVTRSLKQAGVNYAVEQGPDGTWLHFAGRDNDHIMHAVQRAFNKLGLDFNPEESLERPAKINGPAPDENAARAVEQASSKLPEAVSEQAPKLTMRFKTVEWDQQAEIISDNLDKLNIPYERTPGDGIQDFTFAQPYAPAVKQFIDAYSQKVPHFDTGRVANYEQLSQAAQGQSVDPPAPAQASPDEPRGEQPAHAASGKPGEPQPADRTPTRPATQHNAPAAEQPTLFETKDPATAKPAAKRVGAKKPKTLKARFRAQVEQRTKQKLAMQGKPKAPVQKPSRTR